MIHGELKADAETLPLTVASMALTNADMALTRPVGAIAIENADGSRTLIGPDETSGVTTWVGDTTPPPAPKGLTAECMAGTILVTWDGTLEDTTPADFGHITVWTRKDGAADWQKAGDLTTAGSLTATGYQEGDIVDIRATAWDDAHAEDGTPSPNQSDPSDVLTVIVEPPVSQRELTDRATTILAAAKQDAAAQAKTVNDGLTAANKRISANADAIAAEKKTREQTDATVKQIRTDVDANTSAATALKRQQADLSKQLAAQAERITANEQGVSANAKQVKAAKSSIDSMAQTIGANKSAQDAINSQQAETNKQISANATEIAAAKKRISANESALGMLNDTTLPGINSTLAQADKDIAANKTAIASANKQISANASALSTANANVTKAQQTADSAVSNALAAQQTADGKNRVYRQPGEPAHTGLNTGDLWYRTNWYTYWNGDPDNSPSILKTVDDQADEVLTWDGSKWNDFELVANDIIAAGTIAGDKLRANAVTADKLGAGSVTADKLAANSVTGAKISADALSGKTIQGGMFRTSNGRLLLNDSGIIAKDGSDNSVFTLDAGTGAIALRGSITSGSSISGTTITGSVFRSTNGRMALNDSGLKLTDAKGAATVTLDAATGAATFNGTVSGSKVTGGTISGATITGSSFTSPDGKTKLNSSGFYVGDKLAYDAASGKLSLSGTITSSTITGASITGGTITGAEFRNSDQSIKLNSSGFKLGDKIAYDNATGTLSLKGSIQSGSTIGAVTITGATVQTSATANRGVKLTSGGLVAYGSDGKAKFTLTTDGTVKTDGMVVANGSITGSSVTGASITGGTITGATVQTSATANRGVKLTSGGIQAWDGNGVQTLKLTGSDNVIAGTLKTASSGSRIEILNKTVTLPGTIPGSHEGPLTTGVITGYIAVNGKDEQTWSLAGGSYIESTRSALIKEVSLSTSDLACVKLSEEPNGAHAYITARHIVMNGVEVTPAITTTAASIMTLSDSSWSYRTGGESTPRCWMTQIGRSVLVHMEVDRKTAPKARYVIGKLLVPPSHGVDITGRCGAAIQPLFIGTDGSVMLTTSANDTWIIFDAFYITT